MKTDGGRTGERGRQIARSAQIKRVGRRWAVPSQSRASERYLVDVEGSACTCPDYEERRGTCEHQHAVMFWIAWGRDVGADGSVTETITIKRRTYAQPCWRAYNASQTHERSYVERLLAALCAGIPQPARKPGPGRKPLPIADVVFAVVMKVFLAMSNRRTQSDLRESAARGNVRTVGHFNTISNFLADPTSTEILTSLVEQSAAPLCTIENGQYAIDSTGFSLRFLRLRVGACGLLAKALRYQWDSIQKVATGKKAVPPALALRVARFAGVPMDELLAPAPGRWRWPMRAGCRSGPRRSHAATERSAAQWPVRERVDLATIDAIGLDRNRVPGT